MHISLDDDLVAQLDRRVGRRRRSAFIAATVRRALDDEQRWEDSSGHEWDADPAGWVEAGRTGDASRAG
jgi:metal-responsive CopG/Arc/MetJ family transcriptional regulator